MLLPFHLLHQRPGESNSHKDCLSGYGGDTNTGIVVGRSSRAGCIILLGRWMNWAAYGRSAVFTQDTRFACFLSLSVTHLEKLQYPPFFYTCISSLLLAVVDTFSSTAVLHRPFSCLFLTWPFLRDRSGSQRERERERDKIYTMGSLCSFGTCTSTYDGFDARKWEGWDGWIRNLALHPSPDQKQNRTVQLKGN
jgi:hypothetical protein